MGHESNGVGRRGRTVPHRYTTQPHPDSGRQMSSDGENTSGDETSDELDGDPTPPPTPPTRVAGALVWNPNRSRAEQKESSGGMSDDSSDDGRPDQSPPSIVYNSNILPIIPTENGGWEDDDDFLDDSQIDQQQNNGVIPPAVGSPGIEPQAPLVSPDPNETQPIDADMQPPTEFDTSMAAAATALTATPPKPVVPCEPDDPSVAAFNFSIPHFDQIVNTYARRYMDPAYLAFPFTYEGHRWELRVHPAIADDHATKHIGLYLAYIGEEISTSLMGQSPKVAFRIIAFHRDVVSEASRKAFAENRPDGIPELLPSADTRNVKNTQTAYYAFYCKQDLGWKNFPLDTCSNFLSGLENTLYVRVQIEREPKRISGTRKLAEFISPQASHGKQWPFIGLFNQGATCYMNSYLQALFYLPCVRAAVYNIPINSEQMATFVSATDNTLSTNHLAIPSAGASSSRSASPANGSEGVDTSIAAALQMLLYKMQTSSRSIDTKSLTTSFGWTARDAFTQHDAQEFSRKILDKLEEACIKQTPPVPPVTRFFSGVQETFLRCLNVAYTSSNVEPFHDLSLNVRGVPNLLSSLKQYVASEYLTGDNQYHAKGNGQDFGKQDAEKGMRILRFPPILQLQLKRFAYDPITDQNQKVNDKFAFEAKMDLSEFEYGETKTVPKANDDHAMTDGREEKKEDTPSRLQLDPNDPPIYHLHSVLVHKGTAGGGHYYAFVRPFLANIPYEHSPWLKFDDETVEICSTSKEAIEKSFGGTYEEHTKVLGKNITLTQHLYASAYMLVYVRDNIVKAGGLEVKAELPVDETKSSSSTAAASSKFEADGDTEMSVEDEVLLPLARTATVANAILKQESSEEVKQESKQDDSQMEVDSGIMANGTANNVLIAPPPLVPRDFTEIPQDVDSFITALSPVEVPLPPRIEESLAEARRAREAKAIEAARIARLFPFRVIVEKEILFQGLHMGHSLGSGGVAGCGLQVAKAATPDMSMDLNQFLFTLPQHNFTFNKTDTLAMVKVEMEKKFGIPIERQQYWRMAPSGSMRPDLYISTDHFPLEQLGKENSSFALKTFLPTLFLRDSSTLDHQPDMMVHTHESGKIPDLPSHKSVNQLDYFPSIVEDRILLMFKFFDVHTQRFYYLGSTVLFASMSMMELKFFLLHLLRAQGIDLEQRRLARQQMAQAVIPPVHVVLPSPIQVAEPIPELVPVPAKTSHTDNEVEEIPPPWAGEEQRWQTILDNKYPALPPKKSETVEYDPFHMVQIRLCPEFDVDRSTEKKSVFPSLSNRLNPTDQYLDTFKKKQQAKLEGQQFDRLSDQYDNIQDAEWTNGTMIIISEVLPDLERQATIHQQIQYDRTVVEAEEQKNLAASTLRSAANGSSHTTNALELFQSYLAPLPPVTKAHLDPKSAIAVLKNRVVIEFRPVVLDHTTMETNLLDPSHSPLHPLAGLSSHITLEVQSTWSVQRVLSQLVREISQHLPSNVKDQYPQVQDIYHYKLWREFSPGQPSIGAGDGTQHSSSLTVTPHEASIATLLAPSGTSLSRHCGTPFTLYYEVSAISLKQLRENWWLNLEYVDPRGAVHRVPSRWLGLCEFEPFLAPKHISFSFGQLQERILSDWVVPNRLHLGVTNRRVKVRDVVLAEPIETSASSSVDATTSTSANSDTTMSDTTPISDLSGEASLKRPHDDATVDAEGPPAKKQKGEDGKPIGAASVDTHLDLIWKQVCVRVYSSNPPIGRGGWLRYPAILPIGVFFQTWDEKDALSEIASSMCTEWYQEMAIRRGRPFDSTQTNIDDQPPLFPLTFNQKGKLAQHYLQPLPLPFTFYIRPSGPGSSVYVHRFTTITPPPQKSSYAFSPLPPILTRRLLDDTLATFRARLAEQLERPIESVQLAIIRPRQYELAPEDDAQESDTFFNLLRDPNLRSAEDRENGIIMGMLDTETKHIRSTSATHPTAKSKFTNFRTSNSYNSLNLGQK